MTQELLVNWGFVPNDNGVIEVQERATAEIAMPFVVMFKVPYDYGNPWHVMQESENATLYPDFLRVGWSRLVPRVYRHTLDFACPYIPLVPFECDDLLEILEYVGDY